MPNLNTILKAEITRLARRSTRPEITAIRKDVARLKREAVQHRRQIVLLKHDNARLMADLNEKLRTAPKASETEMKHARISPRLIRSQRKRLSLSRENFGKLIQVSGQAVLAWEGGKTKPRETAKAALVAIRRLGKREARERLEVLNRSNGCHRAPAAKKKLARQKVMRRGRRTSRR
ncbi:MAG: hypothetical protein ABIJ96_08360 [Elusimicrobiota bacterium]